MHDLRHALRLLRTNPGFSAVAVAIIALAIGANAAMFSLVKGLLLTPLPYPEADRIVRVLERLPGGGPNAISTLNYLDWISQNTAFEFMAAEASWRATLTGADEPILIDGARVSAHYFAIFGVTPALGRAFAADEDQPGRDRVVLLSHRLWERRFGADPAVIGRDISLDGEPYAVVGVLPKGGPFDRAAAQIWRPLAFGGGNLTRDYRWLGASAKLKPGVTLEQARAAMDVIARRLADAHPESNRGWGIAVDRLGDVLISADLRTAVTVLFMATALVLLIGCANLANLALARSTSRRREIAVRAALGATRMRLLQQLLTEHVVIALCGGAAAAGVGYALLKWILWLMPAYSLPPAVEVRIDVIVLLFTLALALATALLFGIGPALSSMTLRPAEALSEGRHGATAGRTGRHLRRSLVVAEVALAFVLLAASGLLMRSFVKLVAIDPGFDPRNVLTAALPIAPERYADPNELNAYLGSIRAAVAAVPGVRETAITSVLPLEGWGFGMPYAIAGRAAADQVDRRRAFFKIVSPSYGHALGIKLLAGRALNDRDGAGAPRVALINETMARREFADADPIGRHILAPEIVPGRTELGGEIQWEIVGVIAGEKITGLGDEISAGIYVSNLQSPTSAVSLIARADVPPESLQGAVRAAVRGVNPDQALSDVRTLEDIVARSVLGNRVMSMLFAFFAAIALLLAAVGLYGVMAYSAAQRGHEMSIRAALGGDAAKLSWLIYKDGLELTLIGLGIGLAGTLATGGVLSSMLYGVEKDDPVTLLTVPVVLAAVAWLACLLPARRIAKADPAALLRDQ